MSVTEYLNILLINDLDIIRRGTHKYFLKIRDTPPPTSPLNSSTEYYLINIYIFSFFLI